MAHNARRLKIATNGRHLCYHDSAEPFFYLADTAWELFHRLNREEAQRYLADRAAKGFTVIQAVALAELAGLAPNAYGDAALIDSDPTRPNEAYFAHVDWVVNKAAELGLFVAMLPTWGCHWKKSGEKAPLFAENTAAAYGRFLGKRYANHPIIWVLGGDRNIDSPAERAVIDALALGVREGDGGAHLITYHPSGPGNSSRALHDATWLDFNMNQSSHGARDHDNGLYIEHDYALKPVKPTLDGEPRYEDMVVGFYHCNPDATNCFDDYDVRQAAYWAVLAGACGHTYGNNNVWQMWAPGRDPVIKAHTPWYEALNHPGAFQMGHLRRLFESRRFGTLVPDQTVTLDGPRTGRGKVRSAIASDGSVAIVYTPLGEKVSIDKSRIKAKRVKELWFDPRYGRTYHIMTHDNWGIQTYTPPTSGRGCDWVLILEDEAAGFATL